MSTTASYQPESLSYLPAIFRAEIELETRAGGRQNPVLALLQTFESNLHFAERVVENSHRLFDPGLVTGFFRRASSPYFSAGDFVDPVPLAAKLAGSGGDDPVAEFLRSTALSETTLQRLDRVEEGDRSAHALEGMAHALAADLNRAIRGGVIYSPERFAHVRFSPETRQLLGRSPRGGELLARFNRLLLQDAYPREIAALPAAPAFLAAPWEREFLQWLASWLGLELDREWFEAADGQGPQASEVPGERHPHAKEIIGNIAGLYRLRGTCEGFRQMAKALLGLDVEILERTWPRGMEIGRHSSIGVETLLVEKPDLERQFVLLVPLTPRNRGLLPLPERGLEIRLLGQPEDTDTAWFPEPDQAPVPSVAASPGQGDALRDWTVKLNKLNRLIEQNKPAHTRCFLAFVKPQTPQKPPMPPMIIGETSIVGNFLIQ